MGEFFTQLAHSVCELSRIPELIKMQTKGTTHTQSICDTHVIMEMVERI